MTSNELPITDDQARISIHTLRAYRAHHTDDPNHECDAETRRVITEATHILDCYYASVPGIAATGAIYDDDGHPVWHTRVTRPALAPLAWITTMWLVLAALVTTHFTVYEFGWIGVTVVALVAYRAGERTSTEASRWMWHRRARKLRTLP